MRQVKRTIAAAWAMSVMLPAAVLAAEYINDAGGDWEVPGNWTGVTHTSGVPGSADSVTIAGSSSGQAVVMDADSWAYMQSNGLARSSTECRISDLLLGGSESASLDIDIGAGNMIKATSSGTYYVGDVAGSDGTLNVLSGSCVLEASIMQIAQSAGSAGQINVIGADASYTAARASGDISLSVGAGGDGTFYIDAGTFQSRMGVSVGANGTFEAAGSGVAEIGIGSYSSLNGSWQQESNGVLKVGIDAGGITPILIDDVSYDGPDGYVNAAFEDGAVLEPYFIDGIQTGKWTVMSVDGSIDDYGLVLDDGGDAAWSFNVVSNIVEVWYGLGDSGYEPAEPLPIVYTNATCVWDGEAGDNDWDNPTNWAFAANNVLPLQGTGSSGAVLQLDTASNHAVYTFAQGDRYYNKIHVGLDADGRFDVLGSGYTLRADNGYSHITGGNGNTGMVNVDGGATLSYGAAPGYIGTGSGSTGIVNVVNGSRVIYGRASGDVSVHVGYNGAYGEVNIVDDGRFYTRMGLSLGYGSGTGLFSVQGSGGQVYIGTENTLDGYWYQYEDGTLQALVSSNGLTTIFVDDKDDDGVGGDVNFYEGSLLDVGFADFEGENGSWDVMTWDGTLTDNGLAFAPGVDTNIWSFAFVEGSTNGVDTLRITATGFMTHPSIEPNITDTSISGTTVSLTWDSEPVVGYNVLSTENLMLGPWTTNIAGITGTGASTTTNLTGSGTKAFYKIEAFGQ